MEEDKETLETPETPGSKVYSEVLDFLNKKIEEMQERGEYFGVAVVQYRLYHTFKKRIEG